MSQSDFKKENKVSLVRDFRDQPYQLFNGLEPATLIFDPSKFGFPNFKTVDLVAACSHRYEPEISPELLRELESISPPRVLAFNKSVGRQESMLGYYAICDSSASNEQLIILYSFFEVSPARFHAYLHAILKIHSH